MQTEAGEEALPVRAETAAGNAWPGEAEEAAFLAEQGAPAAVPSAPAAAGNGSDLPPLPSLDELVQRIPAETRAALDDLFRAKFVAVRRVRPADLKDK